MTAPEHPAIQPETLRPLLTRAAGRIDLQVLAECDSTNLQLQHRARSGAPAGTLLLTQHQTAGRGRRGRSWYQEGQSLAFSLLWRLPPSTNPSGLSLAVGVAVAEALGPQAQLKWPNDILCDGRKLAGILIESAGPHTYVIGIGINLGSLDGLPGELGHSAASVADAAPLEVLARVIDRLVEVLDSFAVHGFAAVHTRWQNRHAYQDLAVSLYAETDSPPLQGVCRGVDQNGSLLIETATCLQTIASGDVSLRLQ